MCTASKQHARIFNERQAKISAIHCDPPDSTEFWQVMRGEPHYRVESATTDLGLEPRRLSVFRRRSFAKCRRGTNTTSSWL